MGKAKYSKKKQLKDSEIELFCQGAQEVLTKIHDRCSPDESKETAEKKQMT